MEIFYWHNSDRYLLLDPRCVYVLYCTMYLVYFLCLNLVYHNALSFRDQWNTYYYKVEICEKIIKFEINYNEIVIVVFFVIKGELLDKMVNNHILVIYVKLTIRYMYLKALLLSQLRGESFDGLTLKTFLFDCFVVTCVFFPLLFGICVFFSLVKCICVW